MSASCQFYTCGRILETVQVDFVTSEGDSTANPIEHALDYNLDTYWYPSSTADQVVTMDLNNTLQERITLAADRQLSSTSNWANSNCATFSVFGGSLLITSDATSQFCSLQDAGFSDFVAGRSYRLKYDYTQNAASWRFQTGGANQVIGTAVNGTNQTLDFDCTKDAASMIITSLTNSADGEFDNFSLRDVTDEDDYEVDGFGVFIRNYNTHFGTSAGMMVEYSDDGSNWTTFADKLIESEMTNTVGSPLRYFINTSSQKRRYWRVTFHDMLQVINVGQIFLLRGYSVTRGNSWPENDSTMFQNTFTARRGAIPLSLQRSRRPLKNISRVWRYADQDVLDAVKGALSDSFGSLRPFIFVEGTGNWIMRFLQDEIDENETDYMLYNPKIDMQELPYVEDGQVF